MKINKLMTILLTALLSAVTLTSPASAQTVPVAQDNGSGSQYSALAKNCVQILDLNVGNASVSSAGNYTKEYRHIGQSDQWGLIYNGTMNFGSKNATNASAADLADNHLPDVTLRWSGGARLPDSTLCDIVLTLSDIHVKCGKSSVSTGQTFKTVIMNGWSFRSQPPRTAGWASSKAATGTYMKAVMKIVDRGTDTVIDAEQYPTMLIEFVDLDIRDKTMKKSASNTDKGNGTFAEGVAMVSGWVGSAVIAPDTNDISNTRLVNTDSWNGNTRIKVDGAKQVEFQNKTGSTAQGDFSTLWSGFIAAARPQGFSWYWTGSSPGGNTMGIATGMGGQPTVAVLAMREGAGASASYLGSAGGGASGVNSWHTNTHIMNSSATYTATPGTGLYLDSMKVDGAAQDISEEEKAAGKSYYFEKLNKYPLPRRDIRNGQVLSAYDSGYYTVQASFRHYPEYSAKKDTDKSKMALGSDEEIHYQVTCTQIHSDAPAGTHALHDDLAGGVLKVDPSTISHKDEYGSAEITPNDDDGDGFADSIDIVFSSDEADGNTPRTVITYTAAVDWDKYLLSDDDSVTNTAAGRNTPEAGGGRTGSSASLGVTTDIKLTKTVSGKLRDETKKFEFEVSLSGLEEKADYICAGIGGGAVSQVVTGEATGSGFRSTGKGEAVIMVEAAGRQGLTIKGIPVGATYRVKESPSDHVASYRLSSESAGAVFASREGANIFSKRELDTETETVDKTDGVITIAFTNTRDPAVISGIPARYGWLAAAAAAVLASGAAALIRKRKEGTGEKSHE